MPSAETSPSLFYMSSTSLPDCRHNGAAIRSFRVKAGMKPGEFATKASLSYAHLDNIENERKQASLEVLYRIAASLDVPIQAIVRDPAVLEIKAVS